MRNNRILVLPDKPRETIGAAGVILAPELAKEKPQTGKIINGRPDWIGLRVHYPSYASTNYFNDELIVISEEDVWSTEEYIEPPDPIDEKLKELEREQLVNNQGETHGRETLANPEE